MSSILNATTSSGLQIAPDNSGSLQLQTNNGTTALTIDTSQNVGIGTASPTTKLTIASTTGTNINLNGRASDGGATLRYYANDGITQNGYIGMTSTYGEITLVANGPLQFSTNSTERMRIDSSGYVQGTVNGLSAGRMQAYQYYRLNSGYAGSNATGAQSLFGVGVTLVGSTVYEFEIVVAMSKTAGTTSHTVSLGFGGTATLNNIGYEASWTRSSTSFADTGVSNVAFYISTASATAFSGATTTAAMYYQFIIKGTVSVNAGGTFIPQYTLSAAPGGAYTTAIGSYVKIAPLGASGANTNIGSWA